MITGGSSQSFALAIYTPDPKIKVMPVVYDLTGASIEIGSAEDNHIVLSGPGVEPYHLAVRQIDSRLCALVDLVTAQKHGESIWLTRQSDDLWFCPEHGRLKLVGDAGRCMLCGDSGKPLWLLRTLNPGDIFPIGESFKATVLSQVIPRQGVDTEIGSNDSPWPDSQWLENPPAGPTLLTDGMHITDADYPIDNANLWVWDPPESPFPVFMHQRATRLHRRTRWATATAKWAGCCWGRSTGRRMGLSTR